jgi:L-ribulose-5-phosphate 4-epimerase
MMKRGKAMSRDLKEQLLQASLLLFDADVMSHSGHGNMSARLPGTDHLLLMGTGLGAAPSIEDIATVTFDGEVVEGELPSVTREIVAMHAGVYKVRSEVGAVIHTHSPHVTSFAIAHKPLPCTYEAFLRFGITEDIPVAAWAPRGSQESVSNIVEQVKQHPYAPAVLLANHGLLAFANTPMFTAQLIIIMEEAAELSLRAQSLGGEQPFPDGALEQERKHMQRFGSAH